MPQSLAKVYVHLIFSTKRREPLLVPGIRDEINSYLAGVLRDLKCPAMIVGSVADHVHLLFSLSKNCSIAAVVEEVKTGSSKWIKTKGDAFQGFHWQNGYGAFSVSQSNVESVRKYIGEQPRHHAEVSFQDEFRAFLNKYGIEYDERYVWD